MISILLHREETAVTNGLWTPLLAKFVLSYR